MTAALEGSEWSAACLSHTLPPGKTRYPFYTRLGGPQGRSGRAENLVPTGIRSRTVQPIVSRYTEWATRPYIYTHTYTYIYIYVCVCVLRKQAYVLCETKDIVTVENPELVCHVVKILKILRKFQSSRCSNHISYHFQTLYRISLLYTRLCQCISCSDDILCLISQKLYSK